MRALGLDPGPVPEARASFATMLKGTATIWVNRGVKIEKGVGYPDRVIGSGFFIDPRGYLLTNHHVIASEVDPAYEGFSRLFLRLSDDPTARIPAKVVGWDPVLDLALVKVEIVPGYVFSGSSSVAVEPGDRHRGHRIARGPREHHHLGHRLGHAAGGSCRSATRCRSTCR